MLARCDQMPIPSAAKITKLITFITIEANNLSANNATRTTTTTATMEPVSTDSTLRARIAMASRLGPRVAP